MTAKDDIKTERERLFPYAEDSSTLVLSCPKHDFCASQLCRAIEDCDAQVLNLNIIDATIPGGSDGPDIPRFDLDYEDTPRTYIELRISHRNTEAAARSVARYGYTVEYTRNAIDTAKADIDSRLESLMRILNV